MPSNNLIDKIKRAYICLEDKQYFAAEQLANEVLALNPEYGHGYAILLLADIKKTYEELEKKPVIISNNKNYKRIMIYGDDVLKAKYQRIDQVFQEYALTNGRKALNSIDKAEMNEALNDLKQIPDHDLTMDLISRIEERLDDLDFISLQYEVEHSDKWPLDEHFDELNFKIKHFTPHIGLEDLTKLVEEKRESYHQAEAAWPKDGNRWSIPFSSITKVVETKYTELVGFETLIKYWDIKTLDIELSYNHIDFYVNKGIPGTCWVFTYKNKGQYKIIENIINNIEERLKFFDVKDVKRNDLYLDVIKNDGKQLKKKADINGCYVATCIYGSYDCPEVWRLRRYRDYYLDAHWWGRAFIKFYYATSPTLVKWFGDKKWFRKPVKKMLERKLNKVKAMGYEDTPYNDKY